MSGSSALYTFLCRGYFCYARPHSLDHEGLFCSVYILGGVAIDYGCSMLAPVAWFEKRIYSKSFRFHSTFSFCVTRLFCTSAEMLTRSLITSVGVKDLLKRNDISFHFTPSYGVLDPPMGI